MIEKMMKSLVKLAIGVINLSLLTVLGFLAYMKYQEIRCVDTVFEVVDSRLGIVRGDYNIVRRGARIFVMQDPSAFRRIQTYQDFYQIVTNLKNTRRERYQKYLTLSGQAV